jgi:hypothetical protein
MNAHGANTAVVATTATAHQQHTSTMAAVTPPRVGPEAMLEVARPLLHNPPGPADFTIDNRAVVSRRWPACHPYYQHNAPQRLAGEPPQHGANAIYNTLTLTEGSTRAFSTTRTSRKSRYGGFAGRTQPCSKDHSLDGEFGVADTTPVRQAARTPTTLTGSRGGCMVLAPYHCMVV